MNRPTVKVIKDEYVNVYNELQDIIEYLVDKNDEFYCTTCLETIDRLQELCGDMYE